MTPVWKESWSEIWSAGHGRDRSYCGIAATDDGYAVDVFQGDTCVASSLFANRDEAERAASRARARYARTDSVVPPAARPSAGDSARTH
jgi:hypothetical protein